MLKCPANSVRGTEGAGYRTLAENLAAFYVIHCVPGTTKMSRLEWSGGIEKNSGFTKTNGMTHADCSTT